MIAIVCLDEKDGMLFNNRRQSRDSAVVTNILTLIGENVLYMSRYSYTLFEDCACGKNIIVCDDPQLAAGENEFCFIEQNSLKGYDEKLEALYIYRWERIYPASVRFEIDLENHNSLELREVTSFSGSSHDKINREEYRRIN